MLTPYLEQMIWEGKASFRTFVAGGAEKSILPIRAEGYVVILSCTYFPRLAEGNDITLKNSWGIQQLTIQSRRGQDVLQFRNDPKPGVVTNTITPASPGTPVTIDLYLIHDSNVIFSFSDAQSYLGINQTVTPAEGTGYENPLDYGKTGLSNPAGIAPISITQQATFSNGMSINYSAITTNGTFTFGNLKFPVTNLKGVTGVQKPLVTALPLAIITYVEISGVPPKNLR